MALGAGVRLGSGVDVKGIGVSVNGSVGASVGTKKVGMSVSPGVLVRGARFGTQSNCPTRMLVDKPMQLACCN